jgi:hypothetical protein
MDPQDVATTEQPSAADMAEFTAGYTDEPLTETPEQDSGEPRDEPQVEQQPAEPAPEYVQLTRQQFDELQSRTAKFEELSVKQQQALDKAFGKLGVVEQDLRTRATAPVTGEISDEDFAELKALDPDIARMVSEGLKNASQKLRLQVPEIDPAPIEDLIEKRVSERLQKHAIDTGVKQLNRMHPGWQDLVQDEQGVVKPDFVAWLDKQDEGFRADVLAFDMSATADAITKFKEHAAAAQAAANKSTTRTNRLDEAVNPRGTGGPAKSGTSDTDEFYAGYGTR